MANINLSAAVRSNLSSLQNTATLMSKTSDRLSTGNKVNSALDNPTNFFTASSLNSRAGDLNQLMDSMANGIKTIEAADNGLTAITKNLESMQSTLRQARQDKSFETESFSVQLPTTLNANQKVSFVGGQLGTAEKSVDLTKNEYRATTKSTAEFNTTGAALGGPAEVTINGKKITFASGDTLDKVIEKINDAGAGVKATKTLDVNGDATADDSGIVLTSSTKDSSILIEGATASLGLGGNRTVDKVAAKVDSTTAWALGAQTLSINGKKIEILAADTMDIAIQKINESGAGVTASKMQVTAADDAIRLTANDKDSAVEVGSAFYGTAATTAGPTATAGGTVTSERVAKSVNDLVNEISSNVGLEGKIRATNDNGKLRIENLSTAELTVRGVNSSGVVDGTSTTSKKIGGNEVRKDLANQYNELRDQLDKLADDASFNGINLLRGDNLKITFNETGNSSIDIQTKGGKTVNSGNLGIETSLEAIDLDTDEGIDAFLDKIKGALNSVRSQASAFGSNLSIVQNRQDFTKSMINTLETGAGNLTLADMNQEAANMMALQTRQSLASSTLSMANQADQGVLQLLR